MSVSDSKHDAHHLESSASHGNGHSAPQYLAPNGQGGGGGGGAGGQGGGNDLSRQISVTLTPSQFEEMYLQPSMKSRAQAPLIKALGNPTPLGIICFVLNLFPTSCVLMGFRGTSAPNGLLPMLGVYYCVGGIGMTVAGVLEFVIGNTFPFLVFTMFGLFWLSLAVLVDPWHQVTTSLAADTVNLYGTSGLYFLFWAIFVSMLTVGALRTNLVLVWILFFVTMTFVALASAYFHYAEAGLIIGSRLATWAGSMGFCACVGGFYLLLDLIFTAVDFPLRLPLGDLSGYLKKPKTE